MNFTVGIVEQFLGLTVFVYPRDIWGVYLKERLMGYPAKVGLAQVFRYHEGSSLLTRVDHHGHLRSSWPCTVFRVIIFNGSWQGQRSLRKFTRKSPIKSNRYFYGSVWSFWFKFPCRHHCLFSFYIQYLIHGSGRVASSLPLSHEHALN